MLVQPLIGTHSALCCFVLSPFKPIGVLLFVVQHDSRLLLLQAECLLLAPLSAAIRLNMDLTSIGGLLRTALIALGE